VAAAAAPGRYHSRGPAVRVQLRPAPDGEWYEPGFPDAVVAVLSAAAKRAHRIHGTHRRKIAAALRRLDQALQETARD
jgi:hypothetical protein